MGISMDWAAIKVYRITHIDNIEHVLQNGITHKNSPNHNPQYKSIGDISLINTRDIKQIRIDNGDLLDFSAPTIKLGDFIPFYFGVKLPMLYVIQNGGNFAIKPTEAAKIIYLVCSVKQIIESHDEYYFSDGHATDNLTSFYDKTSLNMLPTIIDWSAVKANYWGGNDNLNIKRKKQAEFLVATDIPPHYIIGYGCFNEVAKSSLIDIGIAKEKIKVIPKAYF